jgi:hypothetical protein
LLILDRILLLIPGVKYVYPYTLTGAVDAIAGRDRRLNDVTLLHPGGGIAVLVAWALITAAVGAGITMNRDIT